MTFGKRFCLALEIFALGMLISSGAIGQVTTRFTVPGGSATTSKILPGGTVSFEVHIDAPATPTIGSAFRILQTNPAAPSSFFTITARSFTGSIYNDTASGSSDAMVFALPSALLKPQNDDNLGRNTVGLVATAAGSNLFVANYTLTSNAATPLGTYRIQPTTGGTSTVTGDGPTFTDYDMSAALFDIVVGQTLTVTQSGTGTGTVTSDVGLINCGAICSDIYPGSTVTLTATAQGTSIFMGWSGGGCSGIGTCVVTLSAATTVNAQFFEVDYYLTVSLAGTGSGRVTSVPAGIVCPAICSILAVRGAMFTLTAAPSPGSVFMGWTGGGCSGTGTCVVTIGAISVVTATFNDTTAPVATITGFPTNPSTTSNPQFWFISNEAGSTFRCQLDGGALYACTSPTTVSVGNGPHTFSVIATDPAGNPSAPTTYTWTAAGIVVVSAIPTLNAWILMLLALLVGTAGVFMTGRGKA